MEILEKMEIIQKHTTGWKHLMYDIPIYFIHLLMFYFLDMSDTEIAELQHISRAGVFKNRQVALHNMKKILQEEK